jgi:ABC-type Fe3+-siderophore transport system permease subunit
VWDLRRIARALGEERGDSVVEVVLSITLTGIAFGAIFSALSGVTLAARSHTQNVQLEAALTQAKQSLENATYNASGYAAPTIPDVTVTYSAPSAVTGAPTLQSVIVQVSAGGVARSTIVHKTIR